MRVNAVLLRVVFAGSFCGYVSAENPQNTRNAENTPKGIVKLKSAKSGKGVPAAPAVAKIAPSSIVKPYLGGLRGLRVLLRKKRKNSREII